jgi:hypothetical protein
MAPLALWTQCTLFGGGKRRGFQQPLAYQELREAEEARDREDAREVAGQELELLNMLSVYNVPCELEA